MKKRLPAPEGAINSIERFERRLSDWLALPMDSFFCKEGTETRREGSKGAKAVYTRSPPVVGGSRGGQGESKRGKKGREEVPPAKAAAVDDDDVDDVDVPTGGKG